MRPPIHQPSEQSPTTNPGTGGNLTNSGKEVTSPGSNYYSLPFLAHVESGYCQIAEEKKEEVSICRKADARPISPSINKS